MRVGGCQVWFPGMLWALLWAVPWGARAGDVVFRGDVESNLQLGSECGGDVGNCELIDYRNRNIAGFAVAADPSSRVRVNAHVQLRNLNYSSESALEETEVDQPVQPFDVRFREVSASLFDVGVPGLDCKVGIQRIAWGVADGVNPVDRVNPYDFEDPTRLDARLSSPALRLSYTTAELALEAVGVPVFFPAALPLQARNVQTLLGNREWFSFEDARASGQPEVGRVSTKLTRPDHTLRNVQGGARVVWSGDAVGHLGLSYFNGIDSLPQGNGDAAIIGFQGVDRVDIRVPLEYLRQQLVGLEWRRTLGDEFSAWLELVVVFPERARVRFSPGQLRQLLELGLIDQIPDPIPQRVTQRARPYPNAVVGAEYDGAHVYANVQYVYGFPTERYAGEQHHYGWLLVRAPLFEDRLRLTATGGMEVNDSARALAWIGSVGATWLFDDAADFEIGTVVRRTRRASSLRNLGGVPILRLRLTVRF